MPVPDLGVYIGRTLLDQYNVIFEDADILVANKLAPIPVQKDKSDDPSLQDLLAARSAPEGGNPGGDAATQVLEATHRIDRRTSGIVIFAKTRMALTRLDADFRDRAVRKLYVACVEKEPEPHAGHLEHEIRFDRHTNISRAHPLAAPAARTEARTAHAPGEVSAAVLDYSLACRSERYFFLDVVPGTGKHHQIRAQLAAAGCPIRGDLKYGARRSCKSGRIMLHARHVEFDHPRSGEALAFTAPFPEDEPLWAAYIPVSTQREEKPNA